MSLPFIVAVLDRNQQREAVEVRRPGVPMSNELAEVARAWTRPVPQPPADARQSDSLASRRVRFDRD
jgi:hypothetical protein